MLLRSIVSVLALVTATCVSAEINGLPDFTDLVQKVSPSVVNVSGKTNKKMQSGRQPDLEQLPPFFRDFFERGIPQTPRREGQSLGSGFIVSEDGYILTNNHVIASAETVVVRLNDLREFDAKVIGKDPRSDIALLKIEAVGLPAVKFSEKNVLSPGQWVVAIGSPFGFDYSVTAGIVSAVGRSLPNENYVPFIQTDVAINPGNSGGPLFNLDGEVVGINSQIFTRSGGFMGLSFAIPTRLVVNVAEQLKSSGMVKRGYLGVLLQQVTKDLSISFGLERPMGALVGQVLPGPAKKAGFRAGDVIVAFNGTEVERSSDLPPMVGLIIPGSTVPVSIIREKKAITIEVTVEALPDSNKVAFSNPKSGSSLGMDIEDISEEMAKEFELSGGVLVKEVFDDPAKKSGLIIGDVIVQIGTETIDSVAVLRNIMPNLPVDRPIPIRIFRNGQSMFLTLRLTNRP